MRPSGSFCYDLDCSHSCFYFRDSHWDGDCRLSVEEVRPGVIHGVDVEGEE